MPKQTKETKPDLRWMAVKVTIEYRMLDEKTGFFGEPFGAIQATTFSPDLIDTPTKKFHAITEATARVFSTIHEQLGVPLNAKIPTADSHKHASRDKKA